MASISWPQDDLDESIANITTSKITDMADAWSQKWQSVAPSAPAAPQPFSFSSMLPSLTPWSQQQDQPVPSGAATAPAEPMPTGQPTSTPSAPSPSKPFSFTDLLPSLTPWSEPKETITLHEEAPGGAPPTPGEPGGQPLATTYPTWQPPGANAQASSPTPSSAGAGPIDNSSRQAFVKTAWPYMLEAAGGNRDAAEMMLAAAISENGAVGTGKPFWANNFFGLKSGGDAGTAKGDTWEAGPNGERVDLPGETFAAFSSPVAGFRGFFKFLEDNPRYAPALQRYQQTGNASQLFHDINAAGYATNPTWAASIDNIRANQVAPVVASAAQAPTTMGDRAPGPSTAETTLKPPPDRTYVPTDQAMQGGAIPGAAPVQPSYVDDPANAPPASRGQDAVDIASTAQAYGGGTYVFGGGRDQQGYGVPGQKDSDCSGFVSAVWKERGLPLIAHTDGAYNQLRGLGAQEVSEKDAQPGDVVFYMGEGYGGNVTYHMGIYAGPGKILDQSRWRGDSGVSIRPLSHAGSDVVILRDPRMGGAPRTASEPPPIQPTGLAEQVAGAKPTQRQINAASENPAPSVVAGSSASDRSTSSPPGGTTETAPSPPTSPDLMLRQPLSQPTPGDAYPLTDASAPDASAPAPSVSPATGAGAFQDTDPGWYTRGHASVDASGGQPLAGAEGIASPGGSASPGAVPAFQQIPNEDPTSFPRPEYVTPASPLVTATDPNAGLTPPPSPYAAGQQASMEPAPNRFQTSEPTATSGVLDTLGEAATATGQAIVNEATAPTGFNTPPLPSLRGLQAVQNVTGTPGTVIGRRTGEALGLTDDPILDVGGLKVSPLDVAGFIGQNVLDPTNLISGEGQAANRVATEGARALEQAHPGIIQRIAQAVREHLSDNTGRVAALDAERAGTAAAPAYGTLGAVPPSGGAGRPTVEALQDQIDRAQRVIQRSRAAGDDEAVQIAGDRLAELTNQLVDARNARLDLEPRIRSDVGQRIGDMVPPESTSDAIAEAMRPQEIVRPGQASDLSGPVGVPVSRYDRLNASAGPLPAGSGLLDAANRQIGSAIVGGTTGAAVGAGTDPEDPMRGAQRGALIGAGLAVAGHNAMRMAGRRGEGALATLGPVPPHDLRTSGQPGLPGMEDPLRSAGARPAVSTALAIPPQSASSALPGVLSTIREGERRSPAQVAESPLWQTPLGPLHRIYGAVSGIVAPWANRLNTVRYAGMLSDTAGHAFNTLSNAVMQGVDIAASPVAAGLDVGRVALGRAGVPKLGTERQAWFSEIAPRLAGMRAGASVGLQAAGDVLGAGLSRGEAEKLTDLERKGFGTNIPGLAPAGSRRAGAVDFAFEAPLRAMAAADAAFRTTAQGGHLMAEAYAVARRANGGDAPTDAMVREALKNPAVVERAIELAKRSVLQEDRAPTRKYQEFVRSLGPGAPLVQAEIPFVKTPYNVVAQGMGMTPAGLATTFYDIKQGKSARHVEQQLARVMLGTVVMAGAASNYASGDLTGPYPDDPKEASTLPPGWRPWSRKVTLPDAAGGGTYYLPLGILGPLALPAVVGILYGEAKKKGADPVSLEMAGHIVQGVGQYAEQNTFFSGISNIDKLFNSRTNDGKALEKNAEQVAASYSPYIIGGGALGRELQRVMGMPARDPAGAIEAILATHPATAGMVAPAQDVLGRPRSMGISGPAGAVVRGGVESDASVIRAYRKAGEGLSMAAPKQIPDPNTGRPKTLTEAQQHRWRRVYGASLREGWANEGNPQDVETLRKVKSDASQAANETILGIR